MIYLETRIETKRSVAELVPIACLMAFLESTVEFTASRTQLSMCGPRASVTQGPTATTDGKKEGV